MAALTGPFRRKLLRGRLAAAGSPRPLEPLAPAPLAPEVAPVEIAPNDPLLAYLHAAGGVGAVDTLELDSPALRELKAAGIKLAVPLVSQGELIGVLNLGPRLSEQDYSSDDRRLLDSLAPQTRTTPPTTAGCSTASPPRRRPRCASGSSCASRRPRPRPASASSRSSRSPGSSSRTSFRRSSPTCRAGRSRRITA